MRPGFILIVILLCIYFFLCINKSPRLCEADLKHTRISAKLWLDHLLYTRLVIMGILEDRSDLKENLDRLMKNQEEIGALFGRDAPAVEKLLKEHITLAGKVVGDVKKGASTTDADVKALYANAEQIGDYLDGRQAFISMTSRGSKKENIFRHHMKMHIDTLVAMVKDELAKRDAVKSTDAYTSAGMKMAFDMAKLL